MLKRFLLLLMCSSLEGLIPQPPAALEDDSECALYLNGPGRTSAYDYNLNLLRGNLNYDGHHTCITYDAINQAYIDARKRINVARPKGDWKTEQIATVGELVLDISTNLARMYGLTYEEIEKGLPLIDTSKTLIAEVCPPFLSNVECRPGKYRRYDGLCNNLQNPTWGATMAPFQRLLAPLFSDGMNSPRIARSGNNLPLSRVVSRTMHPDEGYHDHAGTVMVIAWGQFMDHDFTLTGTPLDPRNRNDPEECCNRPPHQKHPYCNEIRIPEDDYFYRLFGVKCMDFVRAFPSPRPGCKLGSRVPFNTLTGAIDGNTVYGVTEKFARKLRTGYGGLLRMNPVFEEYGLKDLLPLKLDIPDEGCTRPNKNMYCFEAGEIRVNEQLVLTCMHTLMAREHNRLAKGLAQVNQHWDDETLFQEARRINIAEIQHITYNEFLPILLGKNVMEKFGLLLQKHGYWDGYDPNINPDIIDAFASAAFRFGHSLLPTAVERWSKAHKFIASKRLSELIRRPYDLYRAGVFDEYLMGLMNQVAQAMDDSITQEVTNHLFKKVGARFGMDLVSLNMQRGREFGIPGYMEFRKFCGLPEAHSFQELFGTMPNDTIRRYESIFEHPSDVDLWSGGVSEKPLPDSMLGPTFACLIATQFSYARRGDRFWFELPNQPSTFTPEQLLELRKARLARIICDNTDIIDTTQVYPMVLPDHELNPRVPCKSGILPSIDLTKWAEIPNQFPQQAQPKQYLTEAIFANETHDTNNDGNGTECTDLSEETTMPIKQNNSHVLNLNVTSGSPGNPAKVQTNLTLIYTFNKNEKSSDVKKKAHVKNSLVRRKRQTELQTIILNHLKDQEELYNRTRQRIEHDRKLLEPIIVEDEHSNSSEVTSGEQDDDEKSKSEDAPKNYDDYQDGNFESFDHPSNTEENTQNLESTTTSASAQERLKGGTFNSDSSETQEELKEDIASTVKPEHEAGTESSNLDASTPQNDDYINTSEEHSNNSDSHEDNSNANKEDKGSYTQEDKAVKLSREDNKSKNISKQEVSRPTTPDSFDFEDVEFNPIAEERKVLFDSNEEANEHRRFYNSMLTDSRAEVPTVKPVQYETETYYNQNNDFSAQRDKESLDSKIYKPLGENAKFVKSDDNNRPPEDSNEGGEIFSAEKLADHLNSKPKSLHSTNNNLKQEYEKIPLNYRHDHSQFLNDQPNGYNPKALLVQTPNQYFYFDNNEPSVHVQKTSKQKITPDSFKENYDKNEKYDSREQYSQEEEYLEPTQPPHRQKAATTPRYRSPAQVYKQSKQKLAPDGMTGKYDSGEQNSQEEYSEPTKPTQRATSLSTPRYQPKRIPADKKYVLKKIKKHPENYVSKKTEDHSEEHNDPVLNNEKLSNKSPEDHAESNSSEHDSQVSSESSSAEDGDSEGQKENIKDHGSSEQYSSGEEKDIETPKPRVRHKETRYQSGESSPNDYKNLESKFHDLGLPEIHLPEKITELVDEHDENTNQLGDKKKLDVRDDDFFHKKYQYNPHADDKHHYSSRLTYDPNEGKRKRKEMDKQYAKYYIKKPHIHAHDNERVKDKSQTDESHESNEEDSREHGDEETTKSSRYEDASNEKDASIHESEEEPENSEEVDANEEEKGPSEKQKYKGSGEEVDADGEVEVEEETDPYGYDREFGEFKDRGDDLYEKFVQENFNKMGSFLERSQKLFEDPSVMSSVKKLIKTSRNSKPKRKKKRPSHKYRWSRTNKKPL